MRVLKIILFSFIYFLPWSSYPGLQTIQNHYGSDRTIKIGLLIPDNVSLASRRGAEMAIRNANNNGGYKGIPFQLVVKSMEGPWGTGSKQAVDLVFEDNVCAIVGSPDGRNGHIIEQAAVKTRIVFLSTWASDPTLAQAFVPWYFSCVPNDLQQADALIEEIYNKRHISNIVTISESGYDSRLAVNNFVKKIGIAGEPLPIQVFYDEAKIDFNGLSDQIGSTNIGAIILFGKPSASMKIIEHLKEKKIKTTFFASLSILNEDYVKDDEYCQYENLVFVSPADCQESKKIKFREEFKKTYGRFPGAVAAYSFDGMNLLIESIKKAGPDRSDIQKALTAIRYEGVTGIIQFDEKGKLKGKAGLMEIKSGVPVPVER